MKPQFDSERPGRPSAGGEAFSFYHCLVYGATITVTTVGLILWLMSPPNVAAEADASAARIAHFTGTGLILALGAIAFTLIRVTQSNLKNRQLAAQAKADIEAAAQLSRDVNERVRLIFQNHPSPMMIYDRQTLRLLEVNDAAVAEYGYTRDEFLGMSLADIRPESEIPALLRDMKDGNRPRHRGVWRHRRKNGTLLWAEITVFCYNREGQQREVVLAHNVTSRIETEEALRRSQAALQSLIDNAPFGICRSSLGNDHLESVNPALCRMLGGYTPAELTSMPISRRLYSDPTERERLIQALRATGTLKGHITTFLGRDGKPLKVRVWGALIRDEQDKTEWFEGYIEDLREQSQQELQLQQMQRLESVGRLAGGVAHDFNNLLVVIKLSTDTMLRTVPAAHHPPLREIGKAADRAAALTRQMLAFGRKQVMQARIMNLNTVVTDTSQMLRRIIGEDIELATIPGSDLWNTRLDPDQLAQVILNLAVNARDAMPVGGTLYLETANVYLDERYAQNHAPIAKGNYVMLAVSDTGTGIEKSVLPRIFDPFFTTKELGKGTGLGLSIVYGIVKQSGGYIWVYSEPGQGTTFKLYFPASTSDVELAAPICDVAPTGTGHTVLVVEDEEMIRSNVRDCLQHLGYTVYEAENGEAALELCRLTHNKVDLVLTDLVMPAMSGPQLAAALHICYPGIRVLFMSGYTEDNAQRRDMLEQGRLFLQKPFSVNDLATAVRNALSQPRALAEV